MAFLTFPDLLALGCQIPIVLFSWWKGANRNYAFWLLTAAAFLGPLIWTVEAHSTVWRSDLPAALWTSIAATWGLFMFLAWVERDAWRLLLILAPILIIMGVLASVWSIQYATEDLHLLPTPGARASLVLHIIVSVATYALITVAAAASVAGIIQDQALKAKRPPLQSWGLPALSRCDEMVFRLLKVAVTVLTFGLISGIILTYENSGKIISFDHKTVLVFTAFILMGGILIIHRRSGITARTAARWALSAYLCLTLGYPGVKIVTNILLS